MSPITVIPTPLARRAAAVGNPRNADTCGLYDVAGRMGEANRGPAYLVRTLDALIASEGFPAPFPIVRAGKLVKGAHRDSRWPIVAIDAWFDDRLPPAARALVGVAERAAIDSRLATRAITLFSDDAA